jgi:hypothetical protein
VRPLGRLAACGHYRGRSDLITYRAGYFARARTEPNERGSGVKRERSRRLTASGLVLPLLAISTCLGTQESRPSAIHSTVLASAPKCRAFHPVTNAPSSVPVLGSGPTSLGWGTAHPTFFSNGGDLSGTVWCIAWNHWGSPSSYGHGLSEIYGPHNTRPIVTIEVRAFDLGSCRSGGHLAYKDLDFKQPARPGGTLGPWTEWNPKQADICY